jgi:hypothetical protein
MHAGLLVVEEQTAQWVVMPFLKKLGRRVEPPGLEWKILKMLPRAWLIGTALPVLVAVLARVIIDDGNAAEVAKQLRSIDIFCIAALITIWTAIVTVGIGSFVVFVMKGPAYGADSYPISHADRPRRGHDSGKT